MGNKNYISYILVIVILWQCQPERTDIFMIGDSTMSNKPLEGNPERGWGQMFHESFKENVTVHNHAMNGRSTKSFIDEGRWAVVLDSLKTGDYIFIQFGHNDQKIKDSTRYTAPHGAYKDNLERFGVEKSKEIFLWVKAGSLNDSRRERKITPTFLSLVPG